MTSPTRWWHLSLQMIRINAIHMHLPNMYSSPWPPNLLLYPGLHPSLGCSSHYCHCYWKYILGASWGWAVVTAHTQTLKTEAKLTVKSRPTKGMCLWISSLKSKIYYSVYKLSTRSVAAGTGEGGNRVTPWSLPPIPQHGGVAES